MVSHSHRRLLIFLWMETLVAAVEEVMEMIIVVIIMIIMIMVLVGVSMGAYKRCKRAVGFCSHLRS